MSQILKVELQQYMAWTRCSSWFQRQRNFQSKICISRSERKIQKTTYFYFLAICGSTLLVRWEQCRPDRNAGVEKRQLNLGSKRNICYCLFNLYAQYTSWNAEQSEKHKKQSRSGSNRASDMRWPGRRKRTKNLLDESERDSVISQHSSETMASARSK